jgi:hypothetical protein
VTGERDSGVEAAGVPGVGRLHVRAVGFITGTLIYRVEKKIEM